MNSISFDYSSISFDYSSISFDEFDYSSIKFQIVLIPGVIRINFKRLSFFTDDVFFPFCFQIPLSAINQ